VGIEKHETPLFIFISYTRSDFKDSEELKRELGNLASSLIADKDIVLDLTHISNIVSGEIGALVRLLKQIQGSGRQVRLVVNATVRKTLESTNIVSLPNLTVYADKNEFLDQVHKAIDPQNR